MCGIVGYVGPRDGLEVVLDGLRLLEYRGYDSAGIALIDRDGTLQVAKKAGRIENLEKELRKWREDRATKPQREAPSDRRTVKVNGQEVVVVRKKPKQRTA